MAVTKILARKGRLDRAIAYVKNGDKTEEQLLTATLNCEPGRECRQMMETKRRLGKTDGVQYYHMIQSFHPGEITPELAMEIAKAFASEHLAGYEAVIGVHTDRQHVHAHIVFNSVHADTGKKYHSNAQTYYKQIRAISDRLCREHGLSVVMQGENAQSLRYIEWLRQSRGQPTFRAMLEADLRRAIEDANDLGHFFLLMEHMGYEIRHGSRLGFRLRRTGTLYDSRAQESAVYRGRHSECDPRKSGTDRSRAKNSASVSQAISTIPKARGIYRDSGSVCTLFVRARQDLQAGISAAYDRTDAAGSHAV